MRPLVISDVENYIKNNIEEFHNKKLQGIKKLKLNELLKKKNPYLFKAKHLLTSEQIIRGLLDAYISSKEETIFGNWLEGLAIFINESVYNGKKSGITGIDLEFDNNGKRYIVAIKSGPNWGNSSQISKMKSNFVSAAKTLRTSNAQITTVAVNGCCYGIDMNPDKGDYFKYCGQKFWEFISGDPELYIKIINPLGTDAKKKNDEFLIEYAALINTFTKKFTTEFCNPSGQIDWEKLTKFNSGH